MKRLYYYTVFLLMLFSLTLHAKKKACLIGVSNYKDSNWCHLSSDKDVRLLSEAMNSDWEIKTIIDQNATYQGIIVGLSIFRKSLSLGDTVLVHFSGHGQQMLQNHNDGSEPDFLDEAIVPYDAFMHYSNYYHGEYHIRDNIFSRIIDQIRDDLGSNGLVIVTIDACHSDSMQRGRFSPLFGFRDNNTYRGTPEIFGKTITEEIIKKRFNRDTRPIEVNNNAHVVYISACQAHSRNQEVRLKDGSQYGSLSYAVALSIETVKPFNATVFIDQVLHIMRSIVPYQKPSVRKTF